MTALATIVLLASTQAHADTFTPKDLLLASQRGLPTSTQGLMAAGIDDASAVQKACLLAGGVAEPIVAMMAGPAAGTLPPGDVATACADVGLETLELSAEQQAHADRAQQAYATHQAEAKANAERAQQLEALVRCAPIKGPTGTRQIEEVADDIEAWIRTQVLAGRTEIDSYGWTRSASYGGTGGASTVTVMCAWSEED